MKFLFIAEQLRENVAQVHYWFRSLSNMVMPAPKSFSEWPRAQRVGRPGSWSRPHEASKGPRKTRPTAILIKVLLQSIGQN